MILLIIFSVGVVSAADNATAEDLTADDSDDRLSLAIDDEMTVNDDDNMSYVDLDDGKLGMSNNDEIISISNSSVEVNDSEFDIGDTVSIPFSCENATTVTATVNYDKATVTVQADRIEITGLYVGGYVLSVTTVTDMDHSSVTKNVTVRVTKNSTIDDPIILDNETIWYNTVDLFYPGQLPSGCYKFNGIFDGNATNPVFEDTMPFLQFWENTYVDASNATFINMGITIQNENNVTITGLTINATRFVEDLIGLGSDDELIFITGCENITLDGLTIDYKKIFWRLGISNVCNTP